MVEEVVRVRFCCYLVERPTWETRTEQYSDIVLMLPQSHYTDKVLDAKIACDFKSNPLAF